MKKIIENLIKEFIEHNKKNYNFKTNWDEPLIGFAKVNDPDFLQLKKIVSYNHNYQMNY